MHIRLNNAVTPHLFCNFKVFRWLSMPKNIITSSIKYFCETELGIVMPAMHLSLRINSYTLSRL